MTSEPLPSFYTLAKDGVIINLHLQPRASRNEISGVQNNALKVRLTSPPVDGAANKQCREFLSGLFHLPQSAVTIIAGETSRHKRIHLACRTPDDFRRIQEALAAHSQHTP